MKVYYSPAYNGFVYTSLTKIRFNEQIVNTAGLIDIIGLHAGINTEITSNVKRVANYYKAMRRYMTDCPNNVLKASFDIDGLSVAKECLEWRDTLAFAGWNKTIESPSKRFEVIAGVESYFSDNSLGDYLKIIIDVVRSNSSILDDFLNELEIECTIDFNLFSPLEIDLLKSLQKRGTKITVREMPIKTDCALVKITKLLESSTDKPVAIEKDKHDDSFKILSFEEQDDALRYLSLEPTELECVWINSDNKVLDDWLYLEGQPTCGSKINGGAPQITQLLSIGLGIFVSPMNPKNMIEWLNVPVSPLNYKLRKKLESRIARDGGYYNEKCAKIIDDYIHCKNEFLDLADIERKKKIDTEFKSRSSIVENFLPNIKEPDSIMDGSVAVQKIIGFAKNLSDWCSTKIAQSNDDVQNALLSIVKNECEALQSVLEDEIEDRIPYIQLSSYVSNLKTNINAKQYDAEVGCKTIISQPGQLSCPVDKVVWCDFYNDPMESLKYDFLTPTEKTAFAKTLQLWNENTERKYNQVVKILPFHLANKITLVVIKRKVTEDVENHPILIQLQKNVENLDSFVLNPSIDEKFFKNVSEVNNGMDVNAEGLEIKNAALIKWPERETYSTFEQLVYHPFDYAFSTLANISSLGNSALPKIYSTYGTVAHAVIETLFNTYEMVEGSGTVPYIKKNIEDNFDKVFMDMVNACGATLLLKENVLNLDNYKAKVFKCVNALVQVLDVNNLHVVACEPWLENDEMGFEYGTKIGGYADMILADEQDNPIVFDFKWTSNKDSKIKTIEENKSIQLELYKYLTKELAGRNAEKIAYVILPEVLVVSAQNFIGDNVMKVSITDEDDLLSKLKNSYKYRRKQITDGFIEEATGFAPDMITYQQACEKNNLISLNFKGKKDNQQKEVKPYPMFEIFKAKK